ncbi:hypothetical protein GQ85_19695 [Rhodococcus rhodochrous]|nr:hypothetical protein GQ85_19695 [Rhodococcus rhodochrous]
MQLEFGVALRAQGHQAGVVRAGAHLGEEHVVARDEQFHAEDTAAAERAGHRRRDLPGPGQGPLAHRLGLPGLDVVAGALQVPDRFAEERLHLPGRPDGADGELGDLVLEVDEALDDDPAEVDAPAGERVVPGGGDLVGGADRGLALAGRGHHRLDHARETDLGRGGADLVEGFGEAVRGGGQPEFLGGEAADALPVHGQPGGARGRDHLGETAFLDDRERVGGDRLDLGHDQVGSFGLDEREQGLRVAHVDGVRAVRHLVPGRVRVPVHRDHLDTEPLQRDDHLLAELTGAEQHDAQGAGSERGADSG